MGRGGGGGHPVRPGGQPVLTGPAPAPDPPGVPDPAGSRAASAFSALAWLVALVFAATTVAGASQVFTATPYQDEWNCYVGFHERWSEGLTAALWAPHNEHRIVVARAIYLLDFVGFGARKVFPHVALFGLIGLLALVLGRAAHAVVDLPGQGAARSGLSAYAVLAVSAWIQGDNLTMCCQTQLWSCWLLALVATLAWARSRPRHGVLRGRESAWFALAVLLGVAAAGTQANGLAVGWLLLAAELRQGESRPRRAILFASAALVTAGYLRAELGSAAHSGLPLLREGRLGPLVEFFLAFLGAPFYPVLERAGVAVAAGLGLALLIAVAWIRGWSRHEDEPEVLALHLVLVLFVASAFAATLGRGGDGVADAVAPRYTTHGLVALVVTAILLAREAAPAGRAGWVAGAAFAGTLAALAQPQWGSLFNQQLRDDVARRDRAALALELGVRDWEALESIYYRAGGSEVPRLGDYARARALGIFGEARLAGVRERIGRPGADLAFKACAGQVERREPCPSDPGWVRVDGWAFDREAVRHPPTVLLVDGAGRVAGAAVTGLRRLDVRLALGRGALRAGFSGFVRAEAAGGPLAVGVAAGPVTPPTSGPPTAAAGW